MQVAWCYPTFYQNYLWGIPLAGSLSRHPDPEISTTQGRTMRSEEVGLGVVKVERHLSAIEARGDSRVDDLSWRELN